MFNRRHARPSSTPPVSRNALIAAASAYHPTPSPSLAASAAGAALRNASVSPPPRNQTIGSIPTKRMLARRDSYNSVSTASSTSARPNVRRHSSSGSLSSRQFRAPDAAGPVRRRESGSVVSSDLDSIVEEGGRRRRRKPVVETWGERVRRDSGADVGGDIRVRDWAVGVGKEGIQEQPEERPHSRRGTPPKGTKMGERFEEVKEIRPSAAAAAVVLNLPRPEVRNAPRPESLVSKVGSTTERQTKRPESLVSKSASVAERQTKRHSLSAPTRENRVPSVSPSRTHFSNASLEPGRHHSPPPRSLSPTKSALKHNRSASVGGPLKVSGDTPSSNGSERRRQHVRVSFSDEESIGSFNNFRLPTEQDQKHMPMFTSIRDTSPPVSPKRTSVRETSAKPMPAAPAPRAPPLSAPLPPDVTSIPPPPSSTASSRAPSEAPEITLTTATPPALAPARPAASSTQPPSPRSIPGYFPTASDSSLPATSAPPTTPRAPDSDTDNESIYSDAYEDLPPTLPSLAGIIRPPSPPLPAHFSAPTPRPPRTRRRSATPPPRSRRRKQQPPPPPQQPATPSESSEDESVPTSQFRSSLRSGPIAPPRPVRRYSSDSSDATPRFGRKSKKKPAAAPAMGGWRSRFADSDDDDVALPSVMEKAPKQQKQKKKVAIITPPTTPPAVPASADKRKNLLRKRTVSAGSVTMATTANTVANTGVARDLSPPAARELNGVESREADAKKKNKTHWWNGNKHAEKPKKATSAPTARSEAVAAVSFAPPIERPGVVGAEVKPKKKGLWARMMGKK